MLVLSSQIVDKIDANRGDMSQGEYIEFIIDALLQDKKSDEPQQGRFVAYDDLKEFEEGIKELLRSFFDFFIAARLELGRPPSGDDMESLRRKLGDLNASDEQDQRRWFQGR